MSDIMMTDRARAVNPLAKILHQEPLYAQLTGRLKELIHAGALKPGDRLPSEYRLAHDHGVSRATVREAVRALTADGYLIARQGQGTFVATRPPIDSGLQDLETVTAMIERHGYRAGASETEVSVEHADSALARHLNIPPGSSIVRVERIRTADGEPVVLSRNKFPQALLAEPPRRDQLDGSLLEFLEGRGGIRVIQAVTTLRPVNADAQLARRMGVRRGTAFLLFEQVHYAADNRPCLYCEDYYRNDTFRFRIVRRRRFPASGA